MNKKIKFIILILMILLVVSLTIVFVNINKDTKVTQENETTNDTNNENNNQENLEKVEELKNQISATGDTNLYEVQKDYTGREVLLVKANMKYKVALAGMLKKSLPNLNEIDEIIKNKAPKETGIWIEQNSRKKVNEFIEENSYLESKYYIDDNGYIKIKDKTKQNEYDKKLENIINGDRQYIFNISSVCYIIDNITGEILDYNFEKMDKYQTYEYFEDDKLMIVFINENSNKQLDKKEIFESIINLVR